jgi:Thiamine pyrophosphate enzyme, N-terminal TPP binding domain
MSNAAKTVSHGPAKPKVSDFIVARLRDWGVRRIYGYSGDGSNGLLAALGRAENGPEFIQPAHEELAALMATAHAKYTGEVGVCLVTQGPGAAPPLPPELTEEQRKKLEKALPADPSAEQARDQLVKAGKL